MGKAAGTKSKKIIHFGAAPGVSSTTNRSFDSRHPGHETPGRPAERRRGIEERNMRELAIEKLKKEKKAGKYDRYAAAMKEDTCAALIEFCEQDDEFAQAVYQGGSFEDCMKAVAKNCGSSMSDLEAYRRAVQFYFKGADIRFQMRIDLCAEVERTADIADITETAESLEKPERNSKVVQLDLSSFL